MIIFNITIPLKKLRVKVEMFFLHEEIIERFEIITANTLEVKKLSKRV